MTHATPAAQRPTVQPFASWNPTRGIWETTQLDLYGLLSMAVAKSSLVAT